MYREDVRTIQTAFEIFGARCRYHSSFRNFIKVKQQKTSQLDSPKSVFKQFSLVFKSFDKTMLKSERYKSQKL